jgi:hypothetical protein
MNKLNVDCCMLIFSEVTLHTSQIANCQSLFMVINNYPDKKCSHLTGKGKLPLWQKERMLIFWEKFLFISVQFIIP